MMRAREDNLANGLRVQALYSVGALARLANVSTDLLRRILRANGVTLVRGGRVLSVPLAELQRKIPALWESLCLCEQLRRCDAAELARLARLARLDPSRVRKPQG